MHRYDSATATIRAPLVSVPRVQLHKHTVIARLAERPISDVFLAVASGIGGVLKVVAIERLRVAYRGDAVAVTALTRAANLGSRFRHPHAVQVYELEDVAGEPILVMEHLEGRTLEDILGTAHRSGLAMPHPLLVDVFIAVTSALEELHRLAPTEGTDAPVHGAVTPTNIVVSYAGAVKLLRPALRGFEGDLRASGPEPGPAADPRDDVSSAGRSLLAAVTGRPMSQIEGRAEEVLRNLLERRRPHPALSHILTRSLSADPDERYGGAGEMLADLRRLREEMRKGGPDLPTYLRRLYGDAIEEHQAAIGALVSGEEIQLEPTGATAILSGSPEEVLAVGTSRMRALFAVVVALVLAAGALLVAEPWEPSASPAAVSPPTVQPVRGDGVDSARANGDGTTERPTSAVAHDDGTAGEYLQDEDEPPAWWVELVARLKGGAAEGTGPGRAPMAGGRPSEAPPVASAPAPGEREPDPQEREPEQEEEDAPLIAPPDQRVEGGSEPVPTRPPRVRTGYLTLVTRPWTQVSIGGRVIGTTPLLRVRLPEGTHTIALYNPEAPLWTHVRVRIREGRTTKQWLGLQ